jgi:hypothetical protein
VARECEPHVAGDRIIFSGQSVEAGSGEEAQRFVNHLATGMRIPVRVCPMKPALSVIEPGFDPRWWVPLALRRGISDQRIESTNFSTS